MAFCWVDSRNTVSRLGLLLLVHLRVGVYLVVVSNHPIRVGLRFLETSITNMQLSRNVNPISAMVERTFEYLVLQFC